MKFAKVSIRGFARELEVSEKTVRDAIKSGKINKAIQKKGNRIAGVNKFMAAWEWLENSPSANDFNVAHLPERLKDIVKIGGKPEVEKKDQPAKEQEQNEALSSTEIRERQELLKLEKLQLEVDEKKGLLIQASKVSEEMYNFGAQVKASILAVPERIIDDLMAETDRNEAYIKLQKALNEALKDLADANLK